jgi:2-methylisocitrate lyase-like PEP mutase family enzyme
MRSQAAALKAVLDEPRLQVMPGCGDGMGARLIEEAGFRTGFVSGSSVSAMRLAMPGHGSGEFQRNGRCG